VLVVWKQQTNNLRRMKFIAHFHFPSLFANQPVFGQKILQKRTALLTSGLSFFFAAFALGAPSAKIESLGLQRTKMEKFFQNASREFQIPSDLLKAIAFSETRWFPASPENNNRSGKFEPEHPPVYGVMGLRSDEWFGRSLEEAANLLHTNTEVLMANTQSNIRGAAAILDSHFKGDKSRGELLNWREAIESYSGIPNKEDANLYAQEVFQVLQEGYDNNNIHIRAHQLNLKFKDTSSIDWDPSPNFDASGNQPGYIINHMTEGSFAGAVSWLKNPKSKRSVHFIIRSRDGYIKQLVKEQDAAWHVHCWNPYTVGVEHEGFMKNPDYFTERMYRSSAALSSKLASQWQIPKDDMHIVGHNFWSTPRFKKSPLAALGACNDHMDPGKLWNWKHFYQLISALGHSIFPQR
jgi:N-acetyl-anhydromuramyl-L-alanine amidase AmpD